MKRTIFAVTLCVTLVLSLTNNVLAEKKKILYIDSYHAGYPWSDGITKGVRTVLDGKNIELKIVRMDTKRNTSKNFIRQAAMKAKMEIEKFQPDVVIASDDNASKYLIKPFFKDAGLPFVFCGINWDASMYGYPYKNVTGMIEVASVPELLKYLKPYAKGNRIAYIAADVSTARKEGMYYRKLYKLNMTEKYVSGFSDWVNALKSIQKNCDILIIGNNAGINDWNDAEAKNVILTETKVPSGTLYDFMAAYALIGYVKVPEEQGEWAAESALKILKGTDVASIPITSNKKGDLIINRKIERKLGLTFTDDIVSSAKTVIE